MYQGVHRMTLKVNKSNGIVFAFSLLFILIFFNRYIVEVGGPSILRYTLDLVNTFIFILAIGNKIRIGRLMSNFSIAYLAVLLFGSFATIFNLKTWGFNISYFLFDCRNLIRYLIFFFSCSVLLNESIVKKIFKLFLAFHVINCVFIVYQYFTLEVPKYWMRGDNLNGFFGTATGGNIYVNSLLVSTSIIVLDKWSKKRCSIKYLLAFLGLNLLIAVLIELKAFFAEITIIIFVYLAPYMKRLTARRIVLGFMFIAIGLLLFSFLVQLLYRLYPWMQGTISFNHIIDSMEQSNKSQVGRISFFKDVIILIYNGDWTKAFIGVGLGTANTNNIATPFAQKYFGTNYSWYSMPYILVETGFGGLIAYIWSFVSILTFTHRSNKYYAIAVSATFVSLFILFYDEAFKTEAGYLLFFMLSIPLINCERVDESIIQLPIKFCSSRW